MSAILREGQQRSQLLQGSKALGLALTDEQLSQCLLLLEQIAKWGRVFNLTSVIQPEQMMSVHLFDCLALVAALRQQYPPKHSLSILDVGSGAGLPGLILAICSDPQHLTMQITSVDTVEKKIAFQRQQKVMLALNNFEPIHSRVENLIFTPPGFDLITCRAFASLNDFCEGSRHLLKSPAERNANYAQFVAMKAKTPISELAELSSDIVVLRQQELQVPGLADAARCLVWLGVKEQIKE